MSLVHFNGRQVRELQKRMSERIREFDKNHILFVNGNYWSRAFEDLVPKFDDNMVWAFHYYSDGQCSSFQEYYSIPY